jgi:hypothetical protein
MNWERDNSLASKGDLLDVAVGGVALLLRIARKDIARSMLGKKIRVELSLENTLTKQIFYQAISSRFGCATSWRINTRCMSNLTSGCHWTPCSQS